MREDNAAVKDGKLWAKLWFVLAENKIDQVTCWYEGSDDSGSISDEIFYNRKLSDGSLEAVNVDVAKLPDMTYLSEMGRISSGQSGWTTHYVPVTRSFEEVLTYLADTILDMYFAGWENNDGAEGRIIFDVRTRRVHVEHGERYVEVKQFSREFEPVVDVLEELAVFGEKDASG